MLCFMSVLYKVRNKWWCTLTIWLFEVLESFFGKLLLATCPWGTRLRVSSERLQAMQLRGCAGHGGKKEPPHSSAVALPQTEFPSRPLWLLPPTLSTTIIRPQTLREQFSCYLPSISFKCISFQPHHDFGIWVPLCCSPLAWLSHSFSYLVI